MKKKIITLIEEQLSYVKRAWSEEHVGVYEDGCLCGYFECLVDGVGYLTIDTYCRKSNGCPNGMSWFVDDNVKVWNNSVSYWGYVPEENELDKDEELKLLGYIDEVSAKELREIIRRTIIRDYSYRNTDEYGKTEEDYIEEAAVAEDIKFKDAYYSLLEYIKNIKGSCENCGSDKSFCDACKSGEIKWSLNSELIPNKI